MAFAMPYIAGITLWGFSPGMKKVANMRNKQQITLVLAGIVIAAALWALGIELIYEHNVRRGIPADFRVQRPHAIYNWRT